MENKTIVFDYGKSYKSDTYYINVQKNEKDRTTREIKIFNEFREFRDFLKQCGMC